MASKRETVVDALDKIATDPELMGQCRAAAQAINDGAGASLAALFKLGQIAVEIRYNPAGDPWYPARMERGRAFDLSARALGTTPLRLYQAITVVQKYTAEELEMFCTRKTAIYQQMTLAHLRVITRSSTAIIRRQLIEYFYEHHTGQRPCRYRTCPVPSRGSPR